MTRNLDMPSVLVAADKRHFTYYNRLSEAAQKEFIYTIAMRWAQGLRGKLDDKEKYLIKFNDRVNQYGDMMWQNPDLTFAMMASCGSGRSLQHEYVKAPKKASSDEVLIDFLAIHYPGLNQDEANILISQMDKTAFTQLLKGTGLETEQEKKIAAAYAKTKSNSSNRSSV
jgi:hypothetical protein